MNREDAVKTRDKLIGRGKVIEILMDVAKPFALPYMALMKRYIEIVSTVDRLDAFADGKCGACAHFGTKACRRRVKNQDFVSGDDCLTF